MSVGKKYVTKDDSEAFARKMLRRIVGGNISGSSAASGGVSEFIKLSDVPGSYSGGGLYIVRVNAAETGLEFVALSLDDLPDIDFSSPHVPGDGEVLTYDGGSGTWVPAGHDLLSLTHPDTTPAAVVNGDLLVGQGGKWARFAKGDDGKIFEMVSGAPAWGKRIYVSASAPDDGVGANGDVWIQRI
jgi:hypothetical protein